MKLAYSGSNRFADYVSGYTLYCNRKGTLSLTDYKRVVRNYCKLLADRLTEDGIIDLPANLGSVAVANMKRRPQYRGKKFIGYGSIDWKTGQFNGDINAFGIVFLPNRRLTDNLRCYGFVANKRLFQKLKASYINSECFWHPMDFTNDMI